MKAGLPDEGKKLTRPDDLVRLGMESVQTTRAQTVAYTAHDASLLLVAPLGNRHG